MSELSDRMEAIKTALAAHVPARVVTRDLLDFARRPETELLAGVYTVVSKSEGDFVRYTSNMAAGGTHKLLIVGQIATAQDAAPSAIEDAEGDLVDEIKGFVRNLPDALGNMVLTGWQQSRQLEAPYGWVAFELEILT